MSMVSSRNMFYVKCFQKEVEAVSKFFIAKSIVPYNNLSMYTVMRYESNVDS